MKQILFTLMLYIVALSPLAVVCQGRSKSDWTVVQTLPRGEALEIKQIDGLSDYCVFAGATYDTLFCESHAWNTGEYSVARAAVQQIRRARRGANVSRIVGISTVVGVVAGAAIPPQKGGSRALDGVGGGLAGALGGCVISTAVIPFALLPGKVIYQAPKRGGSAAQPVIAP